MSTITFDTLSYLKQLEDAGVPHQQAEAFVNAQRRILSDVVDSTVATRADVLQLENRLAQFEVKTDGKFTLLQWMLSFNLAFTMAILWRVFG